MGNNYIKQVTREHYNFHEYMTRPVWASIYEQAFIIIQTDPKSILEIGPGIGLLKSILTTYNYNIFTLDFDPELKPDIISSALDIPLHNNSIDTVCAFQMLEHLPFEISIQAMNEMIRVANKYLLISLPNSQRTLSYSIKVPKFKQFEFLISEPKFMKKENIFDGQHYWEINKHGYELSKIIKIFENLPKVKLMKNYRLFSNPYHHFFVFEKIN